MTGSKAGAEGPDIRLFTTLEGLPPPEHLVRDKSVHPSHNSHNHPWLQSQLNNPPRLRNRPSAANTALNTRGLNEEKKKTSSGTQSKCRQRRLPKRLGMGSEALREKHFHPGARWEVVGVSVAGKITLRAPFLWSPLVRVFRLSWICRDAALFPY